MTPASDSSVVPSGFDIRPARPQDVDAILSMIRALAEYEKLAHLCIAARPDLEAALFGPQPRAEVLLACKVDNPVAFALFFHNFSTFLGRPGIYIEDLYVDEPFRRRGFGSALFRYVARIAVERHCGRLEWSVLDWNEPAIQFYEKLGAVAMREWTVFRLTGNNLTELATS